MEYAPLIYVNLADMNLEKKMVNTYPMVLLNKKDFQKLSM